MHHNQKKKRFNSFAWKKAKKIPPFKPKNFKVKEKLELSSCHKNHGPSYWSGTNCITFKRTL